MGERYLAGVLDDFAIWSRALGPGEIALLSTRPARELSRRAAGRDIFAAVGFLRLAPIEHDLAPHYAALRAMADRRALERSALWTGHPGRGGAGARRRRAGGSPAFARDARASRCASPPGTSSGARASTRSGRCSQTDPVLGAADVLLLTEIDCGLGRSGNRNVARELAAALGMSYVFGPSYLTLGGRLGREPRRARQHDGARRERRSSRGRRSGGPRTSSCPSCATSSRRPSGASATSGRCSPSWRCPSGPPRRGRLSPRFERLAPPARPAARRGPRPPRGRDLRDRRRRLQFVHPRPLVAVRRSLRDVVNKLVGRGVRRTIDGYMTPERAGERPLFDLLRRARLRRSRGSTISPPRPTTTISTIPTPSRSCGARAGGRWSGSCGACCDAGTVACRPGSTGSRARGCAACRRRWSNPRDGEGRAVSDHAAIVCDVTV